MKFVIVVVIGEQFPGLLEVLDLGLCLELLPEHFDEARAMGVALVGEGVVHFEEEIFFVSAALEVGEGGLDVRVEAGARGRHRGHVLLAVHAAQLLVLH